MNFGLREIKVSCEVLDRAIVKKITKISILTFERNIIRKFNSKECTVLCYDFIIKNLTLRKMKIKKATYY